MNRCTVGSSFIGHHNNARCALFCCDSWQIRRFTDHQTWIKPITYLRRHICLDSEQWVTMIPVVAPAYASSDPILNILTHNTTTHNQYNNRIGNTKVVIITTSSRITIHRNDGPSVIILILIIIPRRPWWVHHGRTLRSRGVVPPGVPPPLPLPTTQYHTKARTDGITTTTPTTSGYRNHRRCHESHSKWSHYNSQWVFCTNVPPKLSSASATP